MYIPRLAEQKLNALLSSQKVLIILGARQVGKTTLVKRLLDRKQGIFLNLDTEVDKARLRTAAALPPLEALRTLGTPEVIVIDEAQQLPETARIVKGWYDEKLPTKVILLGSSALNLLDQSAEALTGRNLKLFLPPLTFEELLASQTWYQPQLPPAALATTLADQVQALLLEALVYGSYPEVTHTEDREEYLLNLTSDYLLKDVLQAGLVKTPQTLKQLLLYLAQHIGSELSTKALAEELHVSRPTIERYLDLLEDTYVIFRLPAYTTGGRAEISRNQKVYFWDTGVRNAVLKEFSYSRFRGDITSLWENWVVAEVAKWNLLEGGRHDLAFWRTRDGASVDLIIKDYKSLHAFSITWNPRQVNGGRAFHQQYGTEVIPITPTQPLVRTYLKS